MPDIDVLRPNGGTSDATGAASWTLVGGATIQAVTSDDSDATYVLSPAPPDSGILTAEYPTHTPAAGFARHRVRHRVRARQDNAGGSGFVIANSQLRAKSTGAAIGTQLSLSVTASPVTLPSAYSSAAAAQLANAGAIDFYTVINYLNTSSDELRVLELYIDVDCRAEPSFTGDVLDAAGVSQDGGTITDTNRPRFTFADVLLDGLPARNYSIIVTNTDTGAVVDNITVNGAAPGTVIRGPYENGNYSAQLIVRSTIRINDAFPSDTTTLTFEIDFIAPASPVITTTNLGCGDDEIPHVEICWEEGTPTANVFDDPPYLELVREDCNGEQRIVVQLGYEGCWCDRFTPYFKDSYGCGSGPGLSIGPIMPTLTDSGASTPDIAFAGDIQITATIVPSNIGEGPITFTLPGFTIAAQWTDPTNKSWWLHLREGVLIFVYSTDGSNFTGLFQPLDLEPGTETKVKVTHDVNNGSGSRVTTFYQSTDGLNWELLSTQVFGTAGTLFNSTAPVTVGYIGGNDTFQYYGGIKDVEIRNGIEPSGSVVANPNFREWPVGDPTYVDPAGKTWTLQGSAEIGDAACVPLYRGRYWGLVDTSLIVTPWDWWWPIEATNPAGQDYVWLKGQASGNVELCLTERAYQTDRPFGAFTPIDGGIPTVITAHPGGRNYSMTFSLENEAELVDLEAVLAQPVVLFQPNDQRDIWLAPNVESVEMRKVGGGRRRRLTASFVEVEPQPVVDPASLFEAT